MRSRKGKEINSTPGQSDCPSRRNERRRGFGFTAAGVLVCLSFLPAASASVIGTLSEANCPGGGATVSLTTMIWSPPGTFVGTGCFDTGIATSLSYSGGVVGPAAVGNIMNLTAGGGSVDQFMTILGTTLDFVLDGFMIPTPSNGTNCASTTSGQTCVVYTGSPFLLTNGGSSTTWVGLTAFGHIADGGGISDWYGTFTTQLTEAPGAVETTILGGGSISSTQSGQFVVSVVVPEPASMTLIGAGLIAIAMARMRRKARV